MRSIFLTILMMIAVSVVAQTDERGLTVSGSVQDVDLKEPMVQATVQLFRQRDSTFVGGTVTDIRGNFSLVAPANGIYRVKVSSVGYQPIQREVTLRRNQSVDLGELLMSAEAVMLKEAVVTGRAAQVIVKKDTLVYNPDAYRTPEGSPIEELIKRSAYREPRSTRTVISPSMARWSRKSCSTVRSSCLATWRRR